MAGCYDIAKHYRFEGERGVAHMSSMTRAVGGPAKYSSQSPSVILAHCAQQLGTTPPQTPMQGQRPPPLPPPAFLPHWLAYA